MASMDSPIAFTSMNDLLAHEYLVAHTIVQGHSGVIKHQTIE